MWWIFTFFAFHWTSDIKSMFPFLVFTCHKSTVFRGPRGSGGTRSKWSLFRKKIPLLFYKSFRGLVHTVVLTLPCVCTALRSELSDYWGIATETVQSGICCCYLYSWSSYKLRGYGALTGSHSYFFSSEKPGKRRGEKRAIINLMPN